MRNFSLVYLFLAAVVIFGVSSCATDDTTGGGDPVLGPSISLLADTGFETTDATINQGASFKVKVNALVGDNKLNTITVKEDGTAIDHTLDRILFNGSDDDANPKLLFGADKDGLTWEIEITGHDSGTRTYEIEVSDEANKTDFVTLDITILTMPIGIAQVGGTSTVESTPGNLVQIMVKANKGATPLKSIGVSEDGALIADLDRLRFRDLTNTFTANPNALDGADKDGFETELYIRANATGGTYDYSIEIEDEDGMTASFNLTILTGTPIDSTYTAVLVSNASGQNEGGLDCHTGSSVAFNSALAELKDQGIDLNLQTDKNWIQKIEPVNSAILRTLDPTQIDNFDFAAIDSKEAIIAAFSTGIDATESEVVNVDDIFIVRKDDDYFLLKVTKVEVTAADNDDFYEFSIKQALN